ncbi:transcriptional repressor gene korB [Citrobacter freundii]|uniref:transcriptional repressor gene korB n=1 Tax=Citrobacter freundii TaxID=546 RepID=UPI00174B474D|nr:ParB/RepB/Spo0J family partition protein [Citrobacter freundii]EAT2029975.1 ParB/RepB/Spo0J family partition protein [Salmonella enterica]MBD5662157.1 ParB/RepB/Spo0J family partition protein [Citrobacter freundii]
MSKKNSGLGLDSVGDLSNFLDPDVGSDGKPLMLDIDAIDPDPEQPRKQDNPGFSEESIKELADTIKARGVKMPISVRENPEQAGRYIINHGERRWRGSKVAGKKQIPAFIDNDYSDDDQVIENIQRNDLTAREIAVHIGRKLAAGVTKSQIAKTLGKSPAFVTQHAALLDLPDCIADAFNKGLIRDVTVVNELVTAYKQDPDEVQKLLEENEGEDITRSAVKVFREFLDDKEANKRDPLTIDAFNGRADGDEGESHDDDDGIDENDVTDKTRKKPEKETDPDKFKKAIVIVEYLGEQGRLLLNKRPTEEGLAWIKFDSTGVEEELNLENVKIICLMEG